MFFVRLYRLLPMLIVVAVTAVIIYIVSSWRGTKPQAKNNVLKFLMGINLVMAAVFLIGTIYALAEQNQNVTDLLGSFFIAVVIFWAIAFICYQVFLSHYPNFRSKPSRAHTVTGLDQFVSRVKQGMGKEAKPDEVGGINAEDTGSRAKQKADEQARNDAKAQARADRARERAEAKARRAQEKAREAEEAARQAQAEADEARRRSGDTR